MSETRNALTLPAALGPGVHSASNRNEYQKQKNNVSGEQSAASHKTDSLTVICEPIVYKMWDPQHLTTL
jgi:hypothetical protein